MNLINLLKCFPTAKSQWQANTSNTYLYNNNNNFSKACLGSQISLKKTSVKDKFMLLQQLSKYCQIFYPWTKTYFEKTGKSTCEKFWNLLPIGCLLKQKSIHIPLCYRKHINHFPSHSWPSLHFKNCSSI